jgi:hypothetical protein
MPSTPATRSAAAVKANRTRKRSAAARKAWATRRANDAALLRGRVFAPVVKAGRNGAPDIRLYRDARLTAATRYRLNAPFRAYVAAGGRVPKSATR